MTHNQFVVVICKTPIFSPKTTINPQKGLVVAFANLSWRMSRNVRSSALKKRQLAIGPLSHKIKDVFKSNSTREVLYFMSLVDSTSIFECKQNE